MKGAYTLRRIIGSVMLACHCREPVGIALSWLDAGLNHANHQ